jgi:hypothetical protein
VNHERAIACEGLFWWGNDVICVVNYVGSRVAEFNTAVPAGTRTGQPTPSDDDDHATAAAATAAAFHQTESHVPGTGGGSRDNNSAAAPGTGGQSSSASHETNNTSLPATPDTTTAGHVAEYTLMCYPRTHLDNHSLLFSIKLPSKPMCVDCHLNQRLLIIQVGWIGLCVVGALCDCFCGESRWVPLLLLGDGMCCWTQVDAAYKDGTPSG